MRYAGSRGRAAAANAIGLVGRSRPVFASPCTCRARAVARPCKSHDPSAGSAAARLRRSRRPSRRRRMKRMSHPSRTAPAREGSSRRAGAEFPAAGGARQGRHAPRPRRPSRAWASLLIGGTGHSPPFLRLFRVQSYRIAHCRSYAHRQGLGVTRSIEPQLRIALCGDSLPSAFLAFAIRDVDEAVAPATDSSSPGTCMGCVPCWSTTAPKPFTARTATSWTSGTR